MAQSLVLTLVGAAVLRVSALSDLYLNYVRPGFHAPLVTAGVVVFATGVLGLVREWRRPYVAPAAGQHRPRAPHVAWLLCLPVITVFLIAPPPLGSFAADRDRAPQSRPPAGTTYPALPRDRPAAMSLGEFVARASGDPARSLQGRQVTLTGFVTRPGGTGRWYLTRMRLGCCAADATPVRVAVAGAPAPAVDTWVEVTGTWVPTPYDRPPPAPAMTVTRLARVAQPARPYE